MKRSWPEGKDPYDPQFLQAVCRQCHADAHQPDPDTLAWSLFVRELIPAPQGSTMSEQAYIPIEQDTLDWLAELGEIAELHRTAPDELIWIWEHPAFRSPQTTQRRKDSDQTANTSA